MIKAIVKSFKTVGWTVICAGAVVNAVDILSKFCGKISECYHEKHR